MPGLAGIAEVLTARTWTEADADAMVGDRLRCCVGHAADEAVRGDAASGGAVSALLLAALQSGAADACLVARTVVVDGHARLQYALAKSAEEVLTARGSTYVLGDFAREAIPLIEAHPGRVAVVCLPCEATMLARRSELSQHVAWTIALFCGHASDAALIDHVTDGLSTQAGAPLAALRFRSGHWRGTLTARFENGQVIERPFSTFGRPQNLYYAAARKCLSCGDHFGFDADISAGDLWSAKFKDDPIKHTALVVKTRRGEQALASAEAAGRIEVADVTISEILDGQRRVAPFHHNVTARARAARRAGISVPDRGQPVKWHESIAARIVVRNALATDSPEGLRRVMSRPAWSHKMLLYVLKGLESLS